MEVSLTETDRAQNKIEYQQILLSYVLGNEAKRNAGINEQARERIAMDCSCHEYDVNLNRTTNFIS